MRLVAAIVGSTVASSELVQCRRANSNCLRPLPQRRPQRPASENPTDLENIFGPRDRHNPCRHRGGAPCCRNLPRPCDGACRFKDKFIPIGKTFLPDSFDPCVIGTCASVEGQANPEISIKTEKCNICPKNCISQPEPGKCCPTCHCGPHGPRDWDPSGRSGEPQESQLRPDTCGPLKNCPFLSCPLEDQYTKYMDCCPMCDYCVDQWGKNTYDDQQAWWFYDKKCICNKGVIECDDNAFPPSPFRPKDCQEPNDPSVTHQHGHEWTNPEEECETCECRDGQITCSKRCPELHCPNEQYPGHLRGECCPVCIRKPKKCMAYGKGHILTIDGNVTNVENCVFTLMSSCEPIPDAVEGITELRPPKTDGKNGISMAHKPDYFIPDDKLSEYDSIDSISLNYDYDDYDPTDYVRRANSKRGEAPAKTAKPWRVDLVTDERGETAGLYVLIGATMIVEIEDWRTLRLNGMDMGLPFENSEIKVIVYCGSMQLQSRDGLVLTLNKDGQVSTTPPGTEESCPHHIPPAWNHGKDFNDGRCKRPTDCVENPTCRDHPKCDPRCRGDGCNHYDCRHHPRCPEREELPPTPVKNQILSPIGGPTCESPRIPPPICGACAYPQRLNPDCVIPETRCAHPSVRKQAHEECLMLKQAPFSPCHDVIDPDPFYHACIQDRCKTFGAKPVCEILEAYSLECHRANVRLRWRMQSNCFKTCPKPFIWSDCGKPCDASCGDLNPQCEGKCVPGCRCPAGLVKHAGGCTKPEYCPNYTPPPVDFDDDTACI